MGSQLKKLFFLAIVLTSLASCTEVDKDEHKTEENALRDTYTRIQQRTVRFNCDGAVTSDKIETLNHVAKTYMVSPKHKKDLWSFGASNVSTRSSGGGIWNDKGKFTLDLAPTLFHMKADEGVNQIDWKFSYCSRPAPDNSKCLVDLSVKETGTMFIHITQVKDLRPGVREIRPTPEQCKDPSTSAQHGLR